MIFTKATLYWQLLYRRPGLWKLWCVAWLFMIGVSVVWAQSPTLVPSLPPLLGAQVDGVAATSNTVVDFTLDRGSALSGGVVDANGIPVFFATVLAQSEAGVYSGSISSDDFQYRIVLPDGTYNLFVMMTVFDPTGMPPGALLTNLTVDLQETVVAAGDTERNLMVPALPPLFTVTGQIINFAALPVPSQAGLVFQSQDGRLWNFAQVTLAEGAANAAYRVMLPADMYDVFLLLLMPDVTDDTDPEAPGQVVTLPVGTATVNADQMFDFNVPATVMLSGLLQDSSGNALAGASVLATSGLPQEPPSRMSALCQANSLNAGSFTSSSFAFLSEDNTLGQYKNLLVPGDYQVAASTPLELLPPATVPRGTLEPQEGDLTFPFSFEMMAITADQVRDFILPPLPEVVLISGRVIDEQNQPVFGVRVRAVSSMLTASPNTFFQNEVRTDEMGDYQLLVLSGVDYMMRACPPTRLTDLVP